MIERLAWQLAEAGIRSAVVITRWLGEQVEDHLRSIADLGLDLHFVRETDERGTVGAVAAAPPHDGSTLFLFADLVTDFDFPAFFRFHRESGATVTLASHTEHHRLQLGEVLSEGNRVTGYLEKPEKAFTICSGIAFLEPAAVEVVRAASGRFGLPDLVSASLAAGLEVVHWPHRAFWFDVNSPAALAEVELALASSL